MSRSRLVLGTRGSALALVQSNEVKARMHQAFPKLEIEIRIIKTSGDRQTDVSLSRSGITGLFTKELEEQLIKRRIDLAVHSLKDMPTRIPQGLTLGAILKREEMADVVIRHPDTGRATLHTILTSSPRRAFQARQIWPESEILEVRGNVETRLKKVSEGKPGTGLLLAAAGLRRLGYLKSESLNGSLEKPFELDYSRLTLDEMIPAPGQGAVAIEIREDDLDALEVVRTLNHSETRSAVDAERSLLSSTGGGCASPVAAWANVERDHLNLKARIAWGNHHEKMWSGSISGKATDAVQLGKSLADEYLAVLATNKP